MYRPVLGSALVALCLASTPAWPDDSECGKSDLVGQAECVQLEPMTIFGTAGSDRNVAGGARRISAEELEQFENTDVHRALRRVPGVSIQLEDGFGLRPNISIRGTATERSSRVTLMEDGVLIAPAPYAAPSAYYFPTFGRIHAVEVLKGPSSITQGPYTVGGAINLISTPIPVGNEGFLQGEYGTDSTWRVHGWYGGGNERFAYLLETHQWRSDGFQSIDRSDRPTGLDKQDYLAKLAFYSDAQAEWFQSLEIKLQASEEDSEQSYLGLTDQDFRRQPQRRYGLSDLDLMHNEHQHLSLTWRLESPEGTGLTVTAYDNDFERAWYKTEGIDFDGSGSPETFRRTSWANVIAAVNTGGSLGGLDAGQLQAILDGADTLPGSIQVRNNSREYSSRGVQALLDVDLQTGAVLHDLQFGLRYHEDEEDRLQRNDSYQQLDGALLLNQYGLEGNAGNQIEDARAWAFFVQDRIETGSWVFTPGLRYERIDLGRTRFNTRSDDPSSRAPSNFLDQRSNDVDVWLPGIGSIYSVSDSTRIVAGIHRGFASPGSSPGVDPEESTNYELGIRTDMDRVSLEAMLFFNDYENLVGICTNSSGSDCEPGAAFNGDGVDIPGLELSLLAQLGEVAGWSFPLQLAYTWMDAEFQTDFDSDFFGEVRRGDPVPYIPDQQLWTSLGMQRGPWSLFLSGNYQDSVCTQASCGRFERTDSTLVFDASAHYRLNDSWTLYAVIENLTDEEDVVAREPYGARAGKPRSTLFGARFSF